MDIRGQVAHGIVVAALQVIHRMIVGERNHVNAAGIQHLGIFRTTFEDKRLIRVRSGIGQRAFKVHHRQIVVKELRDAGKEIRCALVVVHFVE